MRMRLRPILVGLLATLALVAAVLALLSLVLLAFASPAGAQPAPRRMLDRPPVYRIDFPADTDVTVRVVWDEEGYGNADARSLISSRRGKIWSDVAVGAPSDPTYVVRVSLDDWRPGDRLTLCREWAEVLVDGELRTNVTSCHDQWPWPDGTLFLPALAAP